MNQEFNISIAILLLRLVTGILFYFQGYDKIFKIKIDGVVRTFNDSLKDALWDLHFFLPRMVFIVSLLLLPPQNDFWSLDRVFFAKG